MKRNTRRRKGIASVLALMLLAIFAVLAISFVSVHTTNLFQARNQARIGMARLEAESGLSFLLYHLSYVSVSANKTGTALMDALAGQLATRLNGTANLHGGSITYVNSVIAVPLITTDSQGHGFSGTIQSAGDTTVQLCVTGTDGTVRRGVGMNVDLVSGHSAVFDFGVASKSAIQLTGNASVKGKNNATEANILSATYSTDQAFNLNGNVAIQGDISASNPDAYVTLTGNCSIGGDSSNNPDISNHIHLGAGNVDFPEVDQTPYIPLATNIVDSSTNTNGNKTFTNIRIKAGTNPTFSGNITIKGVVYIEKPNQVTFVGNLNMAGVIVTEDAGDNVYTTNTIKFSGNSSFAGPETLPDTPDFHQVRQMPGSFLLAPGFGVSFSGNFGTIGGTMAADAFTFTGNAGGLVKGTIVNYSDSVFSLTGNSSITIDKSGVSANPPGFVVSGKLAANMDSYVEY